MSSEKPPEAANAEETSVLKQVRFEIASCDVTVHHNSVAIAVPALDDDEAVVYLTWDEWRKLVVAVDECRKLLSGK